MNSVHTSSFQSAKYPIQPCARAEKVDLIPFLSRIHSRSNVGQHLCRCTRMTAARFDATTEAVYATDARINTFDKRINHNSEVCSVLCRSIVLNTLQGAVRITYNVIELVLRLIFKNLAITCTSQQKKADFKANFTEIGRSIHLIVKGALQAFPIVGHFVARPYQALAEKVSETTAGCMRRSEPSLSIYQEDFLDA